MNTSQPELRVLLAVGVVALAACSEAPTDVGPTALVGVTPLDGAANIGTSPTIEVRFDGPVAPGTAMLMALQVGDCPGPVVAGSWSRSADGVSFRFVPAEPLASGTHYTIHLGGGITDAAGSRVDLEMHGPGLGGMWVTESMVMGMNGMGMGSMTSHAGPGWRHPNGSYGLAFEFTTAGA